MSGAGPGRHSEVSDEQAAHTWGTSRDRYSDLIKWLWCRFVGERVLLESVSGHWTCCCGAGICKCVHLSTPDPSSHVTEERL